MFYDVTHRTVYRYDTDAALSHHLAHLHPRQLPRQDVSNFELIVEPRPVVCVERTDYYGNRASYFTIGVRHDQLLVTARSRIAVGVPDLPEHSPPWEQVRDSCSSNQLSANTEAAEFCFDSSYVVRRDTFAEYARPSFPPNRPLLEAVADFTSRIYRDFQFDARATTVATPVDEVLKLRRGVCQDFAHLVIACLRSLGLPARYVSGYLETQAPLGKTRLVGADASHAWFSVWCSGHGWVDADPTNNLLPSDRHITVAWGRDYGDVSPLRGVVVGGRGHSLEVTVEVARTDPGNQSVDR